MNRTVFRTTLLCAVAIGIPMQSANAATNVTFTPRAMTTQLCPSNVEHGDREFDGHGPHVKAGVTLKIAADGRSLNAEIGLRAKETTPDWSETSKTWTKKIYDAPSGKKIAAIVSPKQSKVEFDSEPAGFQFIAPSDDMQNFVKGCLEIAKAVIVAYGELSGDRNSAADAERIRRKIDEMSRAMIVGGGNHVYIVPPTSPGPVATFSIVGDTGGPDISTDDVCKDDTRIERIDYAPITVSLVDG